MPENIRREKVIDISAVKVKVLRRFYDTAFGMKLREVGETYAEAPPRAAELAKKGLVAFEPNSRPLHG